MIIKDWWYAIKVCRKYGIFWNPFCTNKYAEFIFSYNPARGIRSQTIRINPFYHNFTDAFLHEVGHLFWYRNLFNKSESVHDFENKIESYDVLHKEFVAWRYSKLVRKDRFNSKIARKCFMSYFPSMARQVGGVEASNKYYAYDKRMY